MMESRPRYSLIDKLTDKLLRDAGVATPAVPIEEIIGLRGISIKLLDLDDVSGLVVRSGQSVVIGVNRRHAPTRKRFTLAHELAHALLHEGEEVHYDRDFRVDFRSGVSSQGVDVKEMEANFFAASILMPWRLLEAEPFIASVDLEEDVEIASLANRYKVSAHAMSIRLGNLAAHARAMHRRRR